MRNTHQRVSAVKDRAAIIKAQRAKKLVNIASISCVCLSLFLIVSLSFAIPSILENNLSGSYDGADYTASIFSNPSALSYIVIGIISFMLGVFMTILCILIKKRSESDGR